MHRWWFVLCMGCFPAWVPGETGETMDTDSDVDTDSEADTDTDTDSDADTDTDTDVDADTDSDTDTDTAPDLDSDGYSPPTDCDDTDPDINPGMREICSDGVDQDCDGVAQECLLEGATSSSAAVATYAISTGQVTNLGQIMGGPEEMIAVSPVSGGTVELMSLGSSGLTLRSQLQGSGELGSRLAASDDLTGDGVPDLIVGERFLYRTDKTGPGRVYVVPGPFGASITVPNQGYEWIGVALDCAGEALDGSVDLDNDGHLDLVVGAPELNEVDGRGRVYVVRGPITGSGSLTSAEWILTAEEDNDAAGRFVGSVPDINGDGARELVVTSSGGTGTPNQKIWIIFSGRAQGTHSLSTADVRIELNNSDYALGPPLVYGSGDLNNDGVEDLMIGSSVHDGYAGKAWWFSGPLSSSLSLSSAAGNIFGLSGSNTGAAIGGGDLDGDGAPELLVTKPIGDASVMSQPAAYAWLNAPATVDLTFDSSIDIRLYGAAGTDFGRQAGIADLDGDGYGEVWVLGRTTLYVFAGGLR